MTKRVVLGHKLVLAHSLTNEQATQLVTLIRGRSDLNTVYPEPLWIAKNKTGYYVYVLDRRVEFFVANPEPFVFEIGGT